MRALLIGCGQMGGVHLNNLLANDSVSALSVVDKDPEVFGKIADKLQAKAGTFFTNLSEALASLDPSNLGLCVIASNTACHQEHLSLLMTHLAQLERPPLLFVEKPLLEDLAELELLSDKLAAYPGHLIGGYLIRHSRASQLAADYLKEQQLNIVKAEVQWTKKRAPTRPSPGVLVDETTHALDLVLSYLLKQTGAQISQNGLEVLGVKGALSAKVIDQEKQLALYGAKEREKQVALYGDNEVKVLADLHYRFSVQTTLASGEQAALLMTGRSSFNAVNRDGAPDFKRCIKLTCTNETHLCLEFDKEGQDALTITRHGEVIVSEQYTGNKAKTELDTAIAYQLGQTGLGCQASRADMIRDLELVNCIQKKITPLLRFMKQDSEQALFFKYKQTTAEVEPIPAASNNIF